MIDLSSWQRRYEALPMTPLRLRFVMDSPPVSYQGLHLDAILAYHVVEDATQGRMFNSSDYIRVPLPLKQIADINGKPLWASTDLLPLDDIVRSEQYYHRRALSPRMTMRNISTGTGRHKEKRTPMPIVLNNVLVADCYGNKGEIINICSSITAIGKKRSGRVNRIEIEDIPQFDLVNEQGEAKRPIPTEWAKVFSPSICQLVSFSPPYWHAKTRLVCYPTGSVVHVAGGVDLHYG